MIFFHCVFLPIKKQLYKEQVYNFRSFLTPDNIADLMKTTTDHFYFIHKQAENKQYDTTMSQRKDFINVQNAESLEIIYTLQVLLQISSFSSEQENLVQRMKIKLSTRFYFSNLNTFLFLSNPFFFHILFCWKKSVFQEWCIFPCFYTGETKQQAKQY